MLSRTTMTRIASVQSVGCVHKMAHLKHRKYLRYEVRIIRAHVCVISQYPVSQVSGHKVDCYTDADSCLFFLSCVGFNTSYFRQIPSTTFVDGGFFSLTLNSFCFMCFLSFPQNKGKCLSGERLDRRTHTIKSLRGPFWSVILHACNINRSSVVCCRINAPCSTLFDRSSPSLFSVCTSPFKIYVSKAAARNSKQ